MTVRSKSLLREYVEAIVIAVGLALVIRSFVVQAFKIPSGSMIPTLLIGDHLLVNKLVYRFRTPERGEVAVFKFPQDRETDFIKRVVALPGDEIELVDGKMLVNQAPVADAHASYSPTHLSSQDRYLRKFHVPRKGETVRLEGPNVKLYQLLVANEIKKSRGADSGIFSGLVKLVGGGGKGGHSPEVEAFDLQAGPDGKIANGRIRVDGKPLETFKVGEDYLFMMGDNRDNSYDSRFWGPVRRDDIVGKAMVIYWSFGNKYWQIRWNRIGDIIH